MREDHHSYIRNFCRLGKENLKKIQACTGFEPDNNIYTIISYELRHYRDLTNRCFNFPFRLPKITPILNVTLMCTTDMRL